MVTFISMESVPQSYDYFIRLCLVDDKIQIYAVKHLVFK